MSETIYQVKGRQYSADSPALQAVLRDIYGSAERPRCMCVEGGVDMYVARHTYMVVKRMPGTGPQHHVTCESYEPDAEQSGLGALMGQAVIDQNPELVEVRLGFPLGYRAGKPIAPGEGGQAAEVKVSQGAMSLRALLHFLFERAGFNRWYPQMEGKRNQNVIHKYLTSAASEIQTKGLRLNERLLVPEAFAEARQAEQSAARRRKLATLYTSNGREQPFALVIGEFKSADECASGRKLFIRHMPETPLFIENKAWDRVQKQYGTMFNALELGLKPSPRLMMAMLVYARTERAFHIDTATCMLTSHQWIPLEGTHEIELIETLVRQRRAFAKPLRYDAASVGQFANALLLDTNDAPTPLHIISPFTNERDRRAKDKLLAASDGVWVWQTDEPFPDLPERRSR